MCTRTESIRDGICALGEEFLPHRSSFPHLERLGCVKRQRGFSQAGEINEN